MTDEELLQIAQSINLTGDTSALNTELALARNTQGQTILHLINLTESNRGNFSSILNRLISLGADINAVDNEGKTPLHYSTTFDNTSLNENTRSLKILNMFCWLHLKANPNIRDNQGNIPLNNIIEKPTILKKILQDFIVSGTNLQLIKEDNWRSLREILLKTPVIESHPPVPSGKIFQLFFDGGRRMTTEDLPLLQENLQFILTEKNEFHLDHRRYAVTQIRELFEESDIENKKEYLEKIEEYQKNRLQEAIEIVKRRSNNILSEMPLVRQERYVNILSELCSQVSKEQEPKIHKLHEILPKVCLIKKRTDAIRQNDNDRLESLDQKLFTILNKEANPEHPHSTTQVFNDHNTRAKVTRYLESKDIANLNIALPIRTTPTSDQLSQQITQLYIAKTSPTNHTAKVKKRKVKSSPKSLYKI